MFLYLKQMREIGGVMAVDFFLFHLFIVSLHLYTQIYIVMQIYIDQSTSYMGLQNWILTYNAHNFLIQVGPLHFFNLMWLGFSLVSYRIVKYEFS